MPWEGIWPTEIEPHLRATLARLAPDLVDDLVQDVAVRLLVHQGDFDAMDRLHAWCGLVARNRMIDIIRRDRHQGGGLPEIIDPERVDDRTLDRIELKRVLRAMTRLSAADNRALLGEPAPGDRAAQNRDGVQRHRARSRLRAILAGVATVLGLRRLARAAAPMALVTAAIVFVVPFLADEPTPDATPTSGTVSPSAASNLQGGGGRPSVGRSGATATTSANRDTPAGAPSSLAPAGPQRPRPGIGVPAVGAGTGQVGLNVHQAPAGNTPTDGNGNSALSCTTVDPVIEEHCVYYPVRFGVPYTIDPNHPTG